MTIPIAALTLWMALAQVAAPLSPGEYRDRAAGIEKDLAAGELSRARQGARSLTGVSVRHDGGTFPADSALFRAVIDAPDLVAARALTPRLRALVEALDALASREPLQKPDRALLEKIRGEQASRDLSAGGTISGPRLHDPQLQVPDSVADRLERFAKWAWKLIVKVLEWIGRLLFSEGQRSAGGGASGWTMLLVFLVIAGLGLIAFLAWRRRKEVRPSALSVSAAPAASERDDDPLSRTANEWERFAAELLAAGRYREAIRAWYHAVLVTLFRAGTLHYRKDRTNWEYAYALPPSVGWRPAFIETTRRFEIEWYGRRDTGAETAQEFTRRAQSILDAVSGRGAEGTAR